MLVALDKNVDKRQVKERREKPPTPGTREWYKRLEEEEEYGEP